jgi:hypothetical protein
MLGEALSFIDLLRKKEIDNIVIPVIQRDYAQGREDNGDVNEIRSRLVLSLKNALRDTGSSLTLDCIYGFIDEEKCFIPIDGQQRLTTLFLLHWYIAVKEKRLDEISHLLRKFTYAVRDTAKEFCEDLVKNQVDFSKQKPSDAISHCQFYHSGVFNADPTIKGMLVMLDEFHVQLCEMYTESDLDKLLGNSPINFWWLKIDNFGLEDDLFIKMNARGKRLTRFELFKSELESKLTDSSLTEEWKSKIDNEWLEVFWGLFEKNEAPLLAENALFRFILFILRSLDTRNDTHKSWQPISSDMEHIAFSNDIQIASVSDNFIFLCCALNRTTDFLDKFCKVDHKSQEVFCSIIKGESPDHNERARLFVVYCYIIELDADLSRFQEFERILNNLLSYQRESDNRYKNFRSSISAATYGAFINGMHIFIKKVREANNDVNEALNLDVSAITGVSGKDAEADKVRYIKQHGSLEILFLENANMLHGLIHNFLFENTLWLTKDRYEQLLKNKQLILRLVQSYAAQKLLLRIPNIWSKSLPSSKYSEPPEIQNFRQHIYGFNDRDSDYGDYLMTAGPGETESFVAPLQKAVKVLSKLSYIDTSKELMELLNEQINTLTFDNVSDYFVKYCEFYTDDGHSYCLIPEQTYIYRLRIASPGFEKHYNPFYKVLAKKLNIQYKASENFDEKLYLPNSITFDIQDHGDWHIEFNQYQPGEKVICQLDKNNILRRKAGEDCIECAVAFAALL